MGRNYKDLDNLDRIELEIPHVRCTAHALCGDRYAADRLTAQCISAAVADRDLLTANLSARAWVLRILWRLHGAGQNARTESAQNADRGSASVLGDGYEFAELFSYFRSLDDEARFVLVLVSVNRLSHDEAAYVFDTTVADLQRRLSRARSGLSALVAGDDLPPQYRSF